MELDEKQLKSIARAMQAAAKASGAELKLGSCLDAISRGLGRADWNALKPELADGADEGGPSASATFDVAQATKAAGRRGPDPARLLAAHAGEIRSAMMKAAEETFVDLHQTFSRHPEPWTEADHRAALAQGWFLYVNDEDGIWCVGVADEGPFGIDDDDATSFVEEHADSDALCGKAMERWGMEADATHPDDFRDGDSRID